MSLNLSAVLFIFIFIFPLTLTAVTRGTAARVNRACAGTYQKGYLGQR